MSEMWPFRKRTPKPANPNLCQECDYREVLSGQQVVPHPPHPPRPTVPPLPPLSAKALVMSGLASYEPPPLRVSKCGGGSVYEPGVTHEHRCIASSPHGGLVHTCECGFTWGSIYTVDVPGSVALAKRLLREHEDRDKGDAT